MNSRVYFDIAKICSPVAVVRMREQCGNCVTAGNHTRAHACVAVSFGKRKLAAVVLLHSVRLTYLFMTRRTSGAPRRHAHVSRDINTPSERARARAVASALTLCVRPEVNQEHAHTMRARVCGVVG